VAINYSNTIEGDQEVEDEASDKEKDSEEEEGNNSGVLAQ
jgi:hypothetical protein